MFHMQVYDAFGKVLRPGNVVAYCDVSGEDVVAYRAIITDVEMMQPESWCQITWALRITEYRGDFKWVIEGRWSDEKFRQSIPNGSGVVIKLAETVEEI